MSEYPFGLLFLRLPADETVAEIVTIIRSTFWVHMNKHKFNLGDPQTWPRMGG
jgi:hypothetical protein